MNSLTIEGAAQVFSYLVAGVDSDEMSAADVVLQGYVLQHVAVCSDRFGELAFARACLAEMLSEDIPHAVEVLADYFAIPAIAILPIENEDPHHCATCNDSGFSGYGSGYDAVCSDCGGQSASRGGAA